MKIFVNFDYLEETDGECHVFLLPTGFMFERELRSDEIQLKEECERLNKLRTHMDIKPIDRNRKGPKVVEKPKIVPRITRKVNAEMDIKIVDKD